MLCGLERAFGAFGQVNQCSKSLQPPFVFSQVSPVPYFSVRSFEAIPSTERGLNPV